MSDHVKWLDEWCPECRAAPGTRCAKHRLTQRKAPALQLHFARGWRCRSCPTCPALPDEMCRTLSGRDAAGPHTARLRRGRREVVRVEVWAWLERRGVTSGSVPFSRRAVAGGEIGTIVLSVLDGRSVEIGRFACRDELVYALEAPVWDRFGSFAGHPRISGTVVWTTRDRILAVVGRRGGEHFEELL